jgi:hypothetical protein
MYDFLCLFPHAAASHSLIHYLNQHQLMQVASYTSVSRSLDDIFAYERHIRPFIKTIGVATKDYDVPDIVQKILGATKRDLLIQTVRDPVQNFVAQVNNGLFVLQLNKALGRAADPWTIEWAITDALTRYITPAAAEDAYEASSFKTHVIVDVEQLKGDMAVKTVQSLWLVICGNANPANFPNAVFKALGARGFTQLRSSAGYTAIYINTKIPIMPLADGDLWLGYYDAKTNIYGGKEVRLHTYPDGNALLPALRLNCPVHMCTYPAVWHGLHPKIRAPLIHALMPGFEQTMAQFNKIFAAAETAMTFSLDSMTPLQHEMLKAGVAADFSVFMRRHPEVAEKWTVTRSYLGI